MPITDGINADGVKEELTSWDPDRGGGNAYVTSRSSSELSQDIRDLNLYNLGAMDYLSTYGGQSLDFGSPISATNIPYPDSPPRGPSELLGDLTFDELLTQNDFHIDDGPLYIGVEGFFLRQNPADPPPYTAHGSQYSGVQLEAPLVSTPADSNDRQAVEKEPDVSSAHAEDKPQDAHDTRNVRNPSFVTPIPSHAADLQNGYFDPVSTAQYSITSPPRTPKRSSKTINSILKPQACGYSNTTKVPMTAPTTSGKLGGSAGLGRTGGEGPPEPLVGQSQVDGSDVFFYYPSFEQAEQALRAHLDYEAPGDDTTPRTNREKAVLVTKLFLAMTDMSLVPTVGEGSRKPQAIRSFEEGKYLDWQIQIVCWRVLEQCISRQRMGPIVPPWQRTRKPKDYETFKQRFDATVEALRCEKQLCKRLMAPYLVDDFVDDPTSYVKRIQQNKTLNDKKKDQIKLGRAAQAASSSISQDSLNSAKTRKRKATDMVQAQSSCKRAKRTKSVKTELGNSHPSQNMVGPSQPLNPYYSNQNRSFPLDPALALQEQNEEWADWVNYGAVLLGADGLPSPMFSPAGGRLAGSSTATNGQILIDPFEDELAGLPYPFQRVPHSQGFSSAPLPTEVEDRPAKPSRKRRKATKD